MTLFFANHQITLKRPRNLSGIKYTISATGTAYSADIQPQAIERINQSGGRIGKTYDAYVGTECIVLEGDKIVTEDGKSYMVKAVSIYAGAGLLDHKQLIIEAQD